MSVVSETAATGSLLRRNAAAWGEKSSCATADAGTTDINSKPETTVIPRSMAVSPRTAGGRREHDSGTTLPRQKISRQSVRHSLTYIPVRRSAVPDEVVSFHVFVTAQRNVRPTN